MAVIALDLGGTKLASAIISDRGRILCRNVVLLEGRQGKAAGRLICDEVVALLTHAQAKHTRITGIGVSVPGISYSKTGRVWAPNIPGWSRYPLKREIETAVSRHFQARISGNLPVNIASDRACHILGEAWRGNAKGCSNAIFLAVGTGIGAGIMVGGKVLNGAHDVAGAVGWMALERPFRREYVRCGCFEFHASGNGLAKAARQLRKDWRAAEIFASFDTGDPLAKEIVTSAIQYWGMAGANLVSLFDPEKIIFGGGVFGPARKFIPAIYAEAKRWAQPIAIKQVNFCPSKLGADAGLFGAACIALRPRACSALSNA